RGESAVGVRQLVSTSPDAGAVGRGIHGRVRGLSRRGQRRSGGCLESGSETSADGQAESSQARDISAAAPWRRPLVDGVLRPTGALEESTWPAGAPTLPFHPGGGGKTAWPQRIAPGPWTAPLSPERPATIAFSS